MSQSSNPKDTHALLQSMLQRLKIQPGREGQACLHTPVPTGVASTSRDEDRGASGLREVNRSPVNGFSANGIASEEFGISAVDSNVGLNGEIQQQPGLGCQVVRGLPSSPTQKGNIDGDKGERSTQPGITSIGTGQLFPAKSLKDADITSFERTDRERLSFGCARITRPTPSDKDAVTSMGQNPDLDQDVKAKLYAWSAKPTDANIDTGIQGDNVLHMENGRCEALARAEDPQVVQTDQKTSNRVTSESKTRRWTQKIKERWRDRPGSFGKKRKEEKRREEQRREQGTEISPQNQLLLTTETFINTSKKEAERILPSLDSRDPSMRPANDFDFGLGSFSLLEEIATGQEWAKFLSLDRSAAAATRGPSEELIIPPGPDDGQMSFRAAVASPPSDFSRAQISPDTLLPVSIDTSDGKQQDIHREADWPEPMEYGHTTSAQPEDILRNSVMRSRAMLNRKRQHQSAGTRDERVLTERPWDAKHADRGESISPVSLTYASRVMEETGESQPDGVVPLCTLNSPPPTPSPFVFTHFAQAPKGVLKHSISHDSESSVEIEPKRRRVEENRRVHFSEEVVTIIPPPQSDPDGAEEVEEEEEEEEEEDSGAEEDSVTEESEVEQAAMEEVAPARRPGLPAWILALKKRNSLRKHRKWNSKNGNLSLANGTMLRLFQAYCTHSLLLTFIQQHCFTVRHHSSSC